MQPFLINARSSSDSFVTMVSTTLSYITDSHPVHTRTGTPPAATSVAACSPPLSVTSRGRSSCRRDSLRGGDGGVDGGGRVDPLGDLVAAGLAHQHTSFVHDGDIQLNNIQAIHGLVVVVVIRRLVPPHRSRPLSGPLSLDLAGSLSRSSSHTSTPTATSRDVFSPGPARR